VTDKPLRRSKVRGTRARASAPSGASAPQRYQRLPTGSHGLDPEMVKHDQRERLCAAMVELIADKGYAAVRISDVSRLAHVSPPTLYSLYANKEELLMGAYEDIADRVSSTILRAGGGEHGLADGMRAFAELAAGEPQTVSLLVLGALGAGPKVRARRRLTLTLLESYVHANRSPPTAPDGDDLTVKALLGGLREVTAARLRDGRQGELPELVDSLADWALAYPRRLPAELLLSACTDAGAGGQDACTESSARPRRSQGRLPSGRSTLSRELIVKLQQERIVDATAAIVSERGLAALTIPAIVRRANVSNETFYALYASKHDAFLGAQKVGMHQALGVTADAYSQQLPDWPAAVAAGLRALLSYLASEPDHARLTLVHTPAATPRAITVRAQAMESFRTYLEPGFELAERGSRPAPRIVAEAVVGGIWQVLHEYIETDRVGDLPEASRQLSYFALAPFLGPDGARTAALG
jgi:AcrR family transcriptional regulator